MIKLLNEMQKEQKYVSIYTNTKDLSKFIFGRILSVNNNYIAIYMISPDGLFDGILVIQTNDICRIEIDSQYSKELLKLISSNNQEQPEYNLDPEKIAESLLSISRDEKKLIAVELLKSGYDDIVGFVEHVENNLCKIKQVDSYGYEDGISYIKISDMTQISFNSLSENKTYELWKINNKKINSDL